MSTPPINPAPLVLSDDPRLVETDWVDYRSVLRPGWTADHFDLLREGSTVHLRIVGLTGDGTGGVSVAHMAIAGFTPDQHCSAGAILTDISQPNEVGRCSIDLYNGYPRFLRVDTSTVTGGCATLTWHTSDPDPT